MKKYFYILFRLLIGGMYACEDPDKNMTLRPYEELPIGLYLTSRGDEFSEWLAVLEYVDRYNATNQATELFTVFVPTNQAVRDFYTSKRVESIEELGLDYAEELVKYHILNDTVSLNDFLAGGTLVAKTFTDDYLEVTFGESAGSDGSSYDNVYLNNEAHVREFAIEASNGLIYVLNNVMRPMVESIYETMHEMELYDIMLEAMNLTGWRDSLNRISVPAEQENGAIIDERLYYTVLAVTDAVFQAAGINSVNDLITRVGAQNDYTHASNALNRYVAYHILSGNVRQARLLEFDMDSDCKLWQTLAENTLIKISREADGKIYLNYDGEKDKASLLEEDSDYPVKNGYIHRLDGYLPIFEDFKPVPVYFDASDYPEVEKYIAANGGEQVFQEFGANGADKQTNLPHSLSCFNYVGGPMGSISSWGTLVYYTVQDNDTYTLTHALNHDFLLFSPGYLGSITISTPPMIPGRYKVSMRYAYVNSMADFRVGGGGSNGGATMFEFTEIENLQPSTVNLYSTIPTDRTMDLFDIDIYDEIEITELQRHPVKITIMDPAGSINAAYRILMDYLLFEPID